VNAPSGAEYFISDTTGSLYRNRILVVLAQHHGFGSMRTAKRTVLGGLSFHEQGKHHECHQGHQSPAQNLNDSFVSPDHEKDRIGIKPLGPGHAGSHPSGGCAVLHRFTGKSIPNHYDKAHSHG